MTAEEKKMIDGIANAMIKDLAAMDNPDTARCMATKAKLNLKLEILKLKSIAK
jgi:hypothetical protein